MGMYSMKFHEVCKNFLYPPLMPVNHLTVLVNKKSWDALPADLKAILEEGMIKAGLDMTAHQNWTGEQWGLNKMAEKGVKMNVLKGADLAKAEEVAYAIWDEEAKKSPESAELVKMVKSYMKEMGHMK
jgi:TRAP-type C4-dicarboxylate transport system substrate-binding protein